MKTSPDGWRQCFAWMMRLPARVLIVLFLAYRCFFSPLLPPACRFIPTCSQYGLDAVRKYGALRGAWLTLRRILRCHPFSRGGYDPVK